MKKLLYYLKVDLIRAVCSVKFLLAILLVIGVLLFATLEGIALNTDVLYVFSIVMYGMPAMMILVGGAVSFAISLCEDMEQKFILQQVIRGNIQKYIAAKVISIFFVSVFTIAVGIFVYAMVLHLAMPWADKAGSQYAYIMHSGGLRIFLKNSWYEAYFLLFGVQYGILAGILSLWAAYASTYISNRMLVLAMPMIVYYFIDYIIASIFPSVPNLAMIFSPSNNIFTDDFFAALLVIVIAVLNFILIYRLLLGKVRRKICE